MTTIEDFTTQLVDFEEACFAYAQSTPDDDDNDENSEWVDRSRDALLEMFKSR